MNCELTLVTCNKRTYFSAEIKMFEPLDKQIQCDLVKGFGQQVLNNCNTVNVLCYSFVSFSIRYFLELNIILLTFVSAVGPY